MTRKQRRMIFLGTGFVCFAFATVLVLFALEDKVTFFYAPSDLVAEPVPPDVRIRLGGLVVDGSVVKHEDGITTLFDLTDGGAVVPVSFTGVLPDLFREGQGIIAMGTLPAPDATFVADEVLAKHDENYMPSEIADALKETGHWQEDYQE
ncbi:MAG: cytochrome c maturation protein CcmE [Alphaproteobacteria bacterium]|nr:cytochrome c maturation protein CcmE [Rhodospirillaceae bacterium]MDG2481180.1 cytochrome c maturation protein CcmE [Alphaproteobacteria bacterium]MBT6205138.1 cytochrome c maturation protein CcmE [Rhodospirillaceae bacterium]MBT6509339.1 cytochrome c maturation protein CcmE [Rhodospirillaceae bacterium]MBT7611923.1 cytochrome c maturation protein CcmE [Rhodospirillaceae bacterium]